MLALIVVGVISSHSAVNVLKGAFLESVGILRWLLVPMVVLCPTIAFAVEQVIGVAWLTAVPGGATSNLESF